MKPVFTYMFVPICGIIVFIHLLKIVLLFVKVGFLDHDLFGPPKTKGLLFAYYAFFIYFFVDLIWTRLSAL